MPTATIVWIEGTIAVVLTVVGAVMRFSTMKSAVPLLVAGLVVAAFVPVTLGVLWKDSRTSAITKGLAVLLAVFQPVFFSVRAASAYIRHRPAAADLIFGMGYCAMMLMLFYLGRGVRAWIDRRPLG
jgi:hypothetical protein